MACASSTCAPGGCCVPVPLGATNMLGFAGGHPCCSYPCIQFPPFKVQICLTLNSQTQATIQQGCQTTCYDSGLLPKPCNIVFQAGQTLDTRGARCRTVVWDRFVPAGAFIRIRLCGAQGCSDTCTQYGADPSYTDACGVPNALLKFAINGTDYASTFEAVAAYNSTTPWDGLGGRTGCLVKAACIGNNTGAGASNTTCCEWYTVAAQDEDPAYELVNWGLGVPNTYSGVAGKGIASLPIGTELVIGPVGNIPVVA